VTARKRRIRGGVRGTRCGRSPSTPQQVIPENDGASHPRHPTSKEGISCYVLHAGGQKRHPWRCTRTTPQTLGYSRLVDRSNGLSRKMGKAASEGGTRNRCLLRRGTRVTRNQRITIASKRLHEIFNHGFARLSCKRDSARRSRRQWRYYTGLEEVEFERPDTGESASTNGLMSSFRTQSYWTKRCPGWQIVAGSQVGAQTNCLTRHRPARTRYSGRASAASAGKRRRPRRPRASAGTAAWAPWARIR